jgi:ATP-binding cassette subfamily C (CFTR/MRP) protein 1
LLFIINKYIGEKGINLSGGQRQRISLARAVYCDADTYLFDDVLSAVDAHVGRTIFDECINGVLKDRTRLLVTHQWQYLKYADHVYVFKEGSITESGSYEQLKQSGEFSETMKQFTTEEEDEEEHEKSGEIVSPQTSTPTTTTSPATPVKEEEKKPQEKGNLMSLEERTTGSVKMSVYTSYVRYAGGWMWVIFILLCFIVAQSMMIVNSWWLAYWSQGSIQPDPGMLILSLLLIVDRYILLYWYILCDRSWCSWTTIRS